jgi:DNA-binding transcriptional MerR regulator
MGRYTIGDAERLLGVKQHVLRYWEKEIPFVEPAKDAFGRRTYTSADLGTLLRLKHLLYERRYTIEGARRTLLSEMEGPRQDAAALLHELRSELLKLFFMAGTRKEKER